MKDIKGNIKEDEQAAFELICERTGTDANDAKGVGYFNRLIKLCSINKMTVTLDYETGKFIVKSVPGSGAKEEEVVTPPKKEYVAPADLNKSDADEDDDPFEL
jgi:hypothetical protein